MAELDHEDLEFLKFIAEELRAIDPKVYEAEATELENIVFRATQE